DVAFDDAPARCSPRRAERADHTKARRDPAWPTARARAKGEDEISDLQRTAWRERGCGGRCAGDFQHRQVAPRVATADGRRDLVLAACGDGDVLFALEHVVRGYDDPVLPHDARRGDA